MGARLRVLLIAPRDSYRIEPYRRAAEKQGVDLFIASEGRHSPVMPGAAGVHIDFSDRSAASHTLLDIARDHPFSAVIGTDDVSIELAAEVGQRLNFPHNPPTAVRLARRKDLARARLADAGAPVPRHWCVRLDAPLAQQLEGVTFPCVAKPVALSASRGVMRANDRRELELALARIERILEHEKVADERYTVLIEYFIAGDEVAVEGLLTDGQFEMLALFDKPDPLNGPYFEETYYITPSRHPESVQAAVRTRVAEACAAYGLREGPIHAECRINEKGVWILEVAARTIGGLCGRLLRFGTGYALEELVLQHALRRQCVAQQESGGAGVLMIPIAHGGILRRVEGVLSAQRIPFIEEVVIDVREGYELVPLPEGSSYLGFIFARAPSPAEAEAALRAAHAELNIVVAPLWRAVAG